MPKLPDRWVNYSNCGKQIEGTRIICFKTPLRNTYFQNDEPPGFRWGVRELIQTIPNIGLVIDLTFSTKYYDPSELTCRDIVYQKILCEGHMIPKPTVVKKFIDTIDEFLEYNRENDKLVGVHCTHGLNRSGYLVCCYMIDRMLFDRITTIDYDLIGVHCTHGLNRTGYLVCRYMIERLGFNPIDAIDDFDYARGHTMERSNYLDHIKQSRKHCIYDSFYDY